MTEIRYPYTVEEDRKILRYILDGNHESVLGGNSIWMQMEEQKICPGRSWQSLKNRFKRNIIKDCWRPEFGLTEDERILLRAHSSLPASHQFASKNIKGRSQKPIIRTVRKDSADGENVTESSEKDKEFYSLDIEQSDSD